MQPRSFRFALHAVIAAASLALAHPAHADDAGGDASDTSDASDAAEASNPEAAATDAGEAGAEASPPPWGVVAECPVPDVGAPCAGGTCIAATCYDESGAGPPRACAVCVSSDALGGPYCQAGRRCEGGGVCQVIGGAGGQPATQPDGGAETVYYDLTSCGPLAPPPEPASGYAGSSGAVPMRGGCYMEVAPLRVGRPGAVALGSLLAVAVVAWRRRRARVTRPDAP